MVRLVRYFQDAPDIPRPGVRPQRILRHLGSILIAGLTFVACETQTECPPYAMSRELTLVPRTFELNDSTQTADAAGCASMDEVRFCAYSDGREVRLFAANDGSEDVNVYWPEIIYLDETGTPHRMITFPDSLVDSQLRSSSSTRWQSLVPEEKRALVVTSGMRHQAIAPFVPFQEAADECNRRERVHALAEEDVRVSLEVPYARNGERVTVRIHFGFERIGAFQYQARQTFAEDAIEREVRQGGSEEDPR